MEEKADIPVSRSKWLNRNLVEVSEWNIFIFSTALKILLFPT
jgi:hypothetical protein